MIFEVSGLEMYAAFTCDQITYRHAVEFGIVTINYFCL